MKKILRLFSVAMVLIMLFLCVSIVTSCDGNNGKYRKNTQLDTSENVLLRIASGKEMWSEMDNVITKFEEIYPNCTVMCEYIEDYGENLVTRLNQENEKIDIFVTNNIQESSVYRNNVLNLISDESKKYLDLSHTNKGLLDNFRYTASENTQYAVPYGGEMRGMYVNVTLLKKYGLYVPKNRAELLHCCEVLYANGCIPFQSSNGTFAQQLIYPYICNSIVNGGKYEETYAAIENIDDGISEYLRDAYSFLYEIVGKGYFDYERVKNELGYTFDGSNGKAKDFLNIVKVSEDIYEKADDVGKIAFMPDTQAFEIYLSKAKSDYHSKIEYEFILSPVGENGGFAYLSPSDGLAVNNRSDNTDWALEFLDYFFSPEVSKQFAAETGKIPNTEDALVSYDVSEDCISDVGQVTFSYAFYKTVTTPMLGGYDDMIGISKMNAKKYMRDNGDGTYSFMYTLDEYIARLEAEFAAIKAAK